MGIRAACCVVRHPIKRVIHSSIRHNPVYHLTVEGDASYIAGAELAIDGGATSGDLALMS